MKRYRYACTVLLGLILLSACSRVSAGSTEWRSDALWDDGNAEFCAYEVDWYRYGRLNPGRALIILVKEPWAPELEVKADVARPDGFDVLKLNHVRDVPTGIYTYHQMASVFVRRQSGELQKLVATSSEGCGISTAEMTKGRLQTSSYFDGQGRQEMAYPLSSQSEDGLAMTLRDYIEGDVPTQIEVFPSLMAGRFAKLEVTAYELERTESADVEVPAGTFDTVEIRLTSGARWMTFAFAREAPHVLVKMRQSDGTEYRLAKCERIPYWEMNRQGGESWLPAAVR